MASFDLELEWYSGKVQDSGSLGREFETSDVP